MLCIGRSKQLMKMLAKDGHLYDELIKAIGDADEIKVENLLAVML